MIFTILHDDPSLAGIYTSRSKPHALPQEMRSKMTAHFTTDCTDDPPLHLQDLSTHIASGANRGVLQSLRQIFANARDRELPKVKKGTVTKILPFECVTSRIPHAGTKVASAGDEVDIFRTNTMLPTETRLFHIDTFFAPGCSAVYVTVCKTQRDANPLVCCTMYDNTQECMTTNKSQIIRKHDTHTHKKKLEKCAPFNSSATAGTHASGVERSI